MLSSVFSSVFCVFVGLEMAFLGMLWKQGGFANIFIKTVNFLLVFASAFVLINCAVIPVPYLAVVGIWSLVGGAAWSAEGGSNIGCKLALCGTALTSAVLLLLG